MQKCKGKISFSGFLIVLCLFVKPLVAVRKPTHINITDLPPSTTYCVSNAN